jgi:glycosyltransferase involved in cell wall biosynthesis
MKILKIIHGYPPLYNAGSEVYSQQLCLGLAKHHEVVVFTREENPFAPTFSCRITTDHLDPLIKLHLINIPGENYRYRYQIKEVDLACKRLLEEFQPDVVHIGHLNHLSTSLVDVIQQQNIPLVYTLHDYWLMCPRGQFIQRNASNNELWRLCDKQEHERCARHCYAGYFSGSAAEEQEDMAYWTHWVERRMNYIKEIIQYVDIFIAPARYLLERYTHEFVIPRHKIHYLDYGFDRSRFHSQAKLTLTRHFTFGYIGTHIPAKGIQLLIQAFGLIKGEAKLIIWGRPRGYNTTSLQAICQQLPVAKQAAIEWRSEYANEHIMEDVFQHIDCLVVPSIWVENSPLVIHEAQQARVPVITANAGGMAEYVVHEENGLLFEHRDLKSLAKQMQHIMNEPELALRLGQRGYLASPDGNIPDMKTQVADIEQIYLQLINQRKQCHDQTRTLADYV